MQVTLDQSPTRLTIVNWHILKFECRPDWWGTVHLPQYVDYLTVITTKMWGKSRRYIWLKQLALSKYSKVWFETGKKPQVREDRKRLHHVELFVEFESENLNQVKIRNTKVIYFKKNWFRIEMILMEDLDKYWN